jgi:DNA-binding MarR family transcriptional regulator
MPPRLSLDDFLPYRLAYTSNLVSEAVARTYKALFGLTIPEWRLVAHVAERGGATQQEVVVRSRMDKVTVSRAAIALTRRGLISRQPHASDRRSQVMMLTAAGERLYGEIAPKALELEASIFGGFAPAERRALLAVLDRIEGAVDGLATERAATPPA